MRTIRLVASLLVAAGATAFAPGAVAADPATAPTADPAPAPATDARHQKEATRSRSNIQNNREAPAGGTDGAAPAEATAGVVKTKTKSNQSND